MRIIGNNSEDISLPNFICSKKIYFQNDRSISDVTLLNKAYLGMRMTTNPSKSKMEDDFAIRFAGSTEAIL